MRGLSESFDKLAVHFKCKEDYPAFISAKLCKKWCGKKYAANTEKLDDEDRLEAVT